MSPMMALGPIWCGLFAFLMLEWIWAAARLQALLRELPARPSEAVAELESATSALEAVPGRAMLYGILGTAVGMIQALGAVDQSAAAGDVLEALMGPGAGTTVALLSTAIGLVISDVTTRFARPLLARADAVFWALENPDAT